MARTALFSWAFARHHGGRFVFRIEDTDATPRLRGVLRPPDRRHALARPRLGRGPRGRRPERPVPPVRAHGHLRRRRAAAARRRARLQGVRHRRGARGAPREGARRGPPERLRRAAPRPHARSSGPRTRPRAASRSSGSRCRLKDWTFTDLVRGDITFGAENVQDFVIVRANGQPLYTLTNPTDDALMGITHVLRGEDLLQLDAAADRAVRGVRPDRRRRRLHAGVRPPAVRHGRGQPQAVQARPGVEPARLPRPGLPARGPAQLPGAARLVDRRRPRHLHPRRDGRGVRDRPGQPQPGAVRPAKKCEAINGSHVRLLPTEEISRPARARTSRRPGWSATRSTPDQAARLDAAVPLVHERMTLLTEAVDMLRFLFVSDDEFADRRGRPRQAARRRRARRRPCRARGARGAGGVDDRVHRGRAAGALIDGLGLKPRVAFGPVRVAVTGSRISPPLFESLELLGRETTLRRLAAVLVTRFGRARRPSGKVGTRFRGRSEPLGYGVIGNTAASGAAVLGSSPSTPATDSQVLFRGPFSLRSALIWSRIVSRTQRPYWSSDHPRSMTRLV